MLKTKSTLLDLVPRGVLSMSGEIAQQLCAIIGNCARDVSGKPRAPQGGVTPIT